MPRLAPAEHVDALLVSAMIVTMRKSAKKTIRKAKRKRCPSCIIGGYTQSVAADGRPRFICSRCGSIWTCGLSGGEYVLE